MYASGSSQYASVSLGRNVEEWERVEASDAVLWQITVEVMQAKGVKAADRSGLSDPYCKLTFGSQKYRTTVKKKNLEPTWNEVFNLEMPVDPVLHPLLTLELWDKDQLSRDDFLGRVEIPLASMTNQIATWYPFLRSEKKQETQGEILLLINKTPVPDRDRRFGEMQLELARVCRLRGFDLSISKNGQKVFIPGKAELLEMIMDHVTVEVSNARNLCKVFLTNCRLIIISDNQIADTGDVSMSIPLDVILHASSSTIFSMKKDQTGQAVKQEAEVIALGCLDARSVKLTFASEEYWAAHDNPARAAAVLLTRLKHYIANRDVLTITHELARQLSDHGCSYQVFNMDAEMQRQLPNYSHWERALNNEYQLCETYPSVLYVPKGTHDKLIESSKFRSKQRLPALTWYNQKYGNCIVRCAQPLTGATNKHCVEDEQIVEAIQQTMGEQGKVVIFDARSFIASTGNKLAGKGTEDTHNRYRKCKLLFLDLANIHALRSSYDDLIMACQGGDAEWLQALERSQWLFHLRAMLGGACTIARYVGIDQVCAMVHCSDGWDRTSCLCALAQLMLDPYFRTFTGFRTLVQKDFLAFGHKFQERLSFDDRERSPIFIHFLDCVGQIVQQFPNAFQFTPQYLLQWTIPATTNWFGDFLYDSEMKRVTSRKSFVSFFCYLDSIERDFLNQAYKPMNEIMIPVCSLKRMQVWKEFFLRYDEIEYAALMDTDSNLRHESSIGGTDSSIYPFDDLKKAIAPATVAPANHVMWLPDSSSIQCTDCRLSFNALRRRHHCRSCGKLFCGQCVKNKVQLPHLGYLTEEKVCDNCFKRVTDSAL